MTPTSEAESPRSEPRRVPRFLGFVRRAGDRLPDPVLLYPALWLVVVALSFFAARRGVTGLNPSTGAAVTVTSLASREGLHRMLGGLSTGLAATSHLGAVALLLLGFGVAERSGLFDALFSGLGRRVPSWALPALLVLVSILASGFGDVALILAPSLGACLFRANRRPPLAGAAAGFAGAAGGFGASLLLGPVDASLSAATEAAARTLDPSRTVGVAANYWFAFASGLALTAVAAFVTARWIEPLLAASSPASGGRADAGGSGRAVQFAAIAFLSMVLVVAALVVPERGLLRDETASLRPFFAALPVLGMVVLLVPGAVYGHFAGTFAGRRAVLGAAFDSLRDLGPYLLLALAAAPLVLALDASNLGTVAILKAERVFRAKRAVAASGVPLLLATIPFAGGANLVLPSASAKWSMMAPVVVPAAMSAGASVQAAQAAFRVGDS
ncbi:MAG: AbgT family transporter, partial [Polyangiaceae bacterium]